MLRASPPGYIKHSFNNNLVVTGEGSVSVTWAITAPPINRPLFGALRTGNDAQNSIVANSTIGDNAIFEIASPISCLENLFYFFLLIFMFFCLLACCLGFSLLLCACIYCLCLLHHCTHHCCVHIAAMLSQWLCSPPSWLPHHHRCT